MADYDPEDHPTFADQKRLQRARLLQGVGTVRVDVDDEAIALLKSMRKDEAQMKLVLKQMARTLKQAKQLRYLNIFLSVVWLALIAYMMYAIR